ncbi:dephospho-CoA kinase [Ectothiorhodospira variabilis]|uniref:dephospho-CoA kinase n=1 Tax=Ectothiorhodospira variabilis TaxID=505694 RepID=UPI001EFB700A|nr:dephospho-CoA kinase [Ectothiorhodospira variabilis]MCG5493384.1 dephospho-CoA kinase [Ectothiorhodospira variabilis]MCG5496730.1 dephospho-CoA kinase [Ectothiorhodospira variabilis]MCG5502713.1 dephospho-CoA kinase [Ectothiorhodospira variabilis]MCG5505521.1 dephospho-CoA kinase [Ectothiorhodospira variabilis]
MLTVGLTGGIGSGKSTVGRLFQERGAALIDSDVVARQVVEPGSEGLERLREAFGETILDAQGHLDRSAMREVIFQNSQARHRLESLLHPMIWAEIDRQKSETNAPYCMLVIPLLVESGSQERVDRVLVVDCPEDMQRSRASARDGVSPQQIQAILDAQATRAQRLAAADDVIDNSGATEAIATRVDELHRQYLDLADAR